MDREGGPSGPPSPLGGSPPLWIRPPTDQKPRTTQLGRLGGFLLATCSYYIKTVISAAIHQIAQVGLMYLGAGALLWLAVVVLALLMR